MENKKLLIISQVYVPDPAAVGQYLSDVAKEMVKRGWEVIVFTANRGYDNPAHKYPSRELNDGVYIKRFSLSSFGKNSMVARLLAGMLFIFQAVFHGLFIPKPTSILISTSPPMAPLAAIIISVIRKVPVKYWVMDLNPDQAIELGLVSEKSLPAKFFNWINRLILGRAKDIVALDEFMAKRLIRKLDVGRDITVIPPWPQQEHLKYLNNNENPFRKRHGLTNKFIFMYSGNHTFTNPVTTVLKAALAMQDEHDVLFMFIGGGLGKLEVDNLIVQEQPVNIMSLPYQPFEETGHSLAAADVHIVSVGDKMVGVVHPSKIYGAMAVGRPVLLLGPDPCHASPIIREHDIGWHIQHNDIEGAIRIMRKIIATPKERLEDMGKRTRQLVDDKYNREVLLKQFCEIIAQ